MTRLDEIVVDTRNGLYKPDEFYGTGTPILKMFNIGRLDGKWDLQRVDLIQLTEEELKNYMLDFGDILVNRVNSRELVGKCAVVNEYTKGAVFESKNMRLRLNHSLASPIFVSMWLNGENGRAQLYQRLKQIVGQATVNRTDILSLQIPLPPLPEQQRIVTIIEEQMADIDAARAAIEAELEALNAMPAAMLRRAFNGEY